MVPENIHTPPTEGHWKFPEGRVGGGGGLKAKLLEEKYDAKLEFPGGWGGGCKTKNLSWGVEQEYFLELHIEKMHRIEETYL